MLTISEPKIAGFTPRWATFPGFSLLFDNPPSAYRTDSGLDLLACDVTVDPAIEFYRRVYEALAKLGSDRLLQTYLFCALPPESYHVTAFDVANQGDLPRVKGEFLESMRELLLSPVDANRFSHPILGDAIASSLATEPWNISFRFEAVHIWGRVMVVKLAPRGRNDEVRFAEFVEARKMLHHAYRAKYGIGAGPNFAPHLSLGYFANAENAELATARLPAWNAAIEKAVGDTPLALTTASMHGFRSMAEFFRVPPTTTG